MTTAQQSTHAEIMAAHPGARYCGHLDDVRVWYKLTDGRAIVVRPDGTLRTYDKDHFK